MVDVKLNQSIIDIAMEHCGSAEAAWDIAVANGVSMTDDISVGSGLELPCVVSSRIVNHYRSLRHSLGTGMSDDAVDMLLGAGVGYWRIGVDFEVR